MLLELPLPSAAVHVAGNVMAPVVLQYTDATSLHTRDLRDLAAVAFIQFMHFSPLVHIVQSQNIKIVCILDTD